MNDRKRGLWILGLVAGLALIVLLFVRNLQALFDSSALAPSVVASAELSMRENLELAASPRAEPEWKEAALAEAPDEQRGLQPVGSKSVAPKEAAAAKPTKPGFFVYGVIRDPQGDPIQAASIVARDASESNRSIHSVMDGSYRLGPLPIGRHTLSAFKQQFHLVTEDLPVLADGEQVRRDFVLTPVRTILVVLVNSRKEPAMPAFFAANPRAWQNAIQVIATPHDPGPIYPPATDPLAGGQQFREPKPPSPIQSACELTIDFEGPGWISLLAGTHVLDKSAFDATTEKVVLVLDIEDVRRLECVVLARLVAVENGQPLAGEAALNPRFGSPGARVEVGSDGLLRIENEREGTAWLTVRAEGRAEWKQPIELFASQTLDLGDIALHAPVEIRGFVSAEQGTPGETEIRWARFEHATRLDPTPNAFRHAMSAANGSFVIPGLAPGRWILQVSHGNRSAKGPDLSKFGSLPVLVDVGKGSVEGVELLMSPLEPVSFIYKRTAPPFLRLVVLHESGVLLDSRWVGRSDYPEELKLPSGGYVYILLRDGVEIHRRRFEVDAKPKYIQLHLD